MLQMWNKVPVFSLNNQNIINKYHKQILVYNYSSVVFTDAMLNVLNCGLNFAILTLKLAISQVLIDFKRFERSVIWHKFWFERENTYEKSQLFKQKRNKNLPKNYTILSDLKKWAYKENFGPKTHNI